ncbi:MAG: hypothetical protein UX30_C0010G0003 [Candidatus Saccharibacteria bacterium GW2011_GWA2_46_10]|nr:MAG: hypothetical protein UX30_C0010G0003 [Candidatus Saccharibacteria bacterium GW2011_GWA2_46_10]
MWGEMSSNPKNRRFAPKCALALMLALLALPLTANAAANDLVFNASNSGVIEFNTASQLKLRLTNDGNVGIGASTPQNELNVQITIGAKA